MTNVYFSTEPQNFFNRYSPSVLQGTALLPDHALFFVKDAHGDSPVFLSNLNK